ncbi:MAG: dehydrogenase, partial [Fuerstia sp.]|nr:dehydrogenase [Fuerstiella sp.]
MTADRRTRVLIALIVAAWSTLCIAQTQAQRLSPEQAVQRMQLADGFEVQLVASEPLVCQPVCIEFDDRGRLWVIQYLQYPNPEGLKRVQVDRYSRTKYDRVPEPPPHGPRGADRITILADTDGDGRMDGGRDFIDGLNLATGLAFGHGGVFVLNVPYLLFYPDRNRDDVPDSDPDVLLTGFGMEDAHSVANSLTWGPDGWLYGCQGSTVTANIRGIEFQQGVWRYHPQTHAFELFCEGGGNSWGLDFDSRGNLFYSTNYGGHVLVHGLQGGYFVKSFSKHGELHNPHSYGYFEHAAHQNFRGGHVTVGGIVYQGDSFPETFRGKYIAGDLLGHGVYWHDIQPQGSTVKTSHGGELLVANDDWFAPTDVTLGPDGAVYVADWCDRRTAHPDPDAEWDRTNGRIYRIAAKGTKPSEVLDFSKLDVNQLLELHNHPSQWYIRHARQELVRRQATSVLPRESFIAPVEAKLREAALQSPRESTALEALWTLQTLDRFDEDLAGQLLDSPHPAVRAWTVRLPGDRRQVSSEMAHRLDEFAEREPAVEVRQQLACTAARLPAHQAMPIINANINRDIDNDDPRLPMLWWWAVERHSVDGREEVLRRFLRPSLWNSKLGREMLLPRLIRRYAAEGNSAGLASVVRLLNAAPDDSARSSLWVPVLQGWQERPAAVTTSNQTESSEFHEFSRLILAAWQAQPMDATLLKLGIAIGQREPLDAARRAAFDRTVEAAQRVTMLDMLAPTSDPSLIEPSLDLVLTDDAETVRSAALRVLSRFDDPRIISNLTTLHQTSPSVLLQSQIRDVLLGRKASARAWLSAVDRGEVDSSATPLEQIRKVALFEDADLNVLVAKHWGRLESATGEEKLAEVRRLNNDLRAAPGNADAGHLVFKKHCAGCHQLFG